MTRLVMLRGVKLTKSVMNPKAVKISSKTMYIEKCFWFCLMILNMMGFA